MYGITKRLYDGNFYVDEYAETIDGIRIISAGIGVTDGNKIQLSKKDNKVVETYHTELLGTFSLAFFKSGDGIKMRKSSGKSRFIDGYWGFLSCLVYQGLVELCPEWKPKHIYACNRLVCFFEEASAYAMADQKISRKIIPVFKSSEELNGNVNPKYIPDSITFDKKQSVGDLVTKHIDGMDIDSLDSSDKSQIFNGRLFNVEDKLVVPSLPDYFKVDDFSGFEQPTLSVGSQM